MPSHPAQKQDPEGDKGADVEESVGLVPARGLGLVRQDEQLPGVEEDWVDLHHEGERAVRDVRVAGDGETIAECHAEVVDKQLICASFSVVFIIMCDILFNIPPALLPVIKHHVQRVIKEVTDREGHEDVAGVGELVDEVILHLRCLKTKRKQ